MAIPTLALHIGGVSPKGNFLNSSMGGKLHNVARSDYYTHPQALPQFGRNTERTHERSAGRSVANKGIGTGYDQGRTGHSKPTTADHQKALQHLCCSVQTVGHRPHRLNRHIPSYVTTRLLVHHGRHPSRHKLHLLRINEEPNQRQNDHGLPKMVDRMKLLALGLKHRRLDNKCLAAFKACIAKNGMTQELVPLDCHHHSIAKWAIQTFKNHFISILSEVDDRFPLSLWCHLGATSGTHHQHIMTEQCCTKSVRVCPCPRAT
jgi:hypothetical protein